MNWAGDLVQKNINIKDSVLDLGCGIMQSTLDTCSSYPSTKLICRDLLGVDIYKPYLNFLKLRGIKTLQYDLRNIPLPFKNKSWDHALLIDILEHMQTFEIAKNLFFEAERIARKKVVVVTPKYFFSNKDIVKNPFPYNHLGRNEFQLHHCFIPKEWLILNGFEIKKGNPNSKVLFAIKDLRN